VPATSRQIKSITLVLVGPHRFFEFDTGWKPVPLKALLSKALACTAQARRLCHQFFTIFQDSPTGRPAAGKIRLAQTGRVWA
jgi:hypothetical protein